MAARALAVIPGVALIVYKGVANKAPTARPNDKPATFAASRVARAAGRISVIKGILLTKVNSKVM